MYKTIELSLSHGPLSDNIMDTLLQDESLLTDSEFERWDIGGRRLQIQPTDSDEYISVVLEIPEIYDE
jgi:hypothetical protein